MLNQFIKIPDGVEPFQREEIERLNTAIKEGNITEADEKMLRRKYFNPQTGELTLLVGNDTNSGIRMASVNLFE